MRPLDYASHGLCVPWTMRPLYDASVRLYVTLMIRPLDESPMDEKSHGSFIPTMRQYAEHVIPLCLTMLVNMSLGFLSYNIHVGSKLSRC
jgi:hypothetical protein